MKPVGGIRSDGSLSLQRAAHSSVKQRRSEIRLIQDGTALHISLPIDSEEQLRREEETVRVRVRVRDL